LLCTRAPTPRPGRRLLALVRRRRSLKRPAAFPPPLEKKPQVNEGVVLAVGPGRRTKDGELFPPSVKEGDKVLLPEYGGALVKMDNKE